MLHVHTSRKRARLLVGLPLLLIGLTGWAHAQSLPAPSGFPEHARFSGPVERAVAPPASLAADKAPSAPCERRSPDGACEPAVTTPRSKPAAGTSAAGASPAPPLPATTQTVSPTVQFSAASYPVLEGSGSVPVTVTRTGPADSVVTVEYSIFDNTATQKSDFTFVAGKLNFASGETSKTFNVLVTEDSHVEGTETATIVLSEVTGGATLGTQSTATLVIISDPLEPATSPNDEAVSFVRQHYADFLNREPDTPGLDFWTKQITSCGDDEECAQMKRVSVSAAFFLSIEFQNTGVFVYHTRKAAFGNMPGTPVPVRFADLLRDGRAIGQGVVVGQGNWEQQLAANKEAFLLDFVRRPDFLARYPDTTAASSFVDSLDANAGGVLSPDEKNALVRRLSPNPSDVVLRADVLGRVAADADLIRAEFTRAFVLMEYFGYLRRDPDKAPDSNYDGLIFWLDKLNRFNGNFINAEMVKAFIQSFEYRRRFGPLEKGNQAPSVEAGPDQSVALAVAANLTGRVSDDVLPDGRALSLSWSKVSGPGAVIFADASAAVTTARFEVEGVYVLRLTANDTQLTGSDEVIVTVGGNTLTVTAIVTPEPNAAGWNNSDVTVTFTCSGGLDGIVTCPEPRTVTEETSGTIISGVAVDGAGQTSIASVTVKLDKTRPVLSITTPADGANLFASPAVVAGAATDALSGLVGVTCNGAAAEIEGSGFKCNVPLSSGANAVATAAADGAGNVAVLSRSLSFTRAPSVAITSPANLSFINISPTTVSGTVDDPAATVLVNAVQAAVVNGSFSVALPLLEGPNTITASATSEDGATGTASMQITLDTTPPRVTITSPSDQFVTTGESISVAGIVNDIVVGTVNEEQAQVRVNGEQAQVANRTFLAKDVPLAVGPNVIRAVGRDRVGNSVTTEITVIRQASTQAQIRLLSGNNQTGAIGSQLASPLVVVLTDAAGNPVPNKPVIFKVTQNDGMVTADGQPAPTVIATTDGQGRAQVRWKLGMRAGAGGNTVEAYSVGFEGTAIFTAVSMQGPAGKVVVDTGNDQIGAANQPLPKPLIVVVVDEGNNRLAGVPVTFAVKAGGGSFGGQETYTVNTDSDGRAAATLTLGLQEGNANNLVEVNFPSNTEFPASFTASGRAAGDPAKTTITGVVLDNSNVPIPGVTVRAVLTNVLTANSLAVQTIEGVQTDEQGQFTIAKAPVGFVELLVDGSTAQRPGNYPTLDYDMVTVAGQNNTVGQPIFLLPLNTDNKLCVTPTEGGGTLTIPEAPGFSLTFGPGQVTFPGGSQTGCISVTVVHGDKVPMVPGFGQQPRFIVTIQPAGAHFNTPARITLPNVDGLRPREVTEMYSFDHDIGSFVAIGTGVVSDDGRIITSSPGVGVLKAGWHCGGNPNTNGTAANCSDCKTCRGNNCVADHSQDGTNPRNSDTCCFNGEKLNKYGQTVGLILPGPLETKCPQRTQNDRRKHFIDGCTIVPDDPMRFFNPLGLLTDKSTAFGQSLGEVDTRAAAGPLPCNQHDLCYQTCAAPGTSLSAARATCDNAMKERMDNVCEKAYPSSCPDSVPFLLCPIYFTQRFDCFRYSVQYWAGLKVLGGVFGFNGRQEDYCKCCQ
jgi:hypothetical protein